MHNTHILIHSNLGSIDKPHNFGAMYCKACDMWLNGPVQMDDHVLTKKHKTSIKQMTASEQKVEEKATTKQKSINEIMKAFMEEEKEETATKQQKRSIHEIMKDLMEEEEEEEAAVKQQRSRSSTS